MKTVIRTICNENYAAHNGFDGNFRWKVKPGSTYVIDSVDTDEVNEVVALIDEEYNDVHYEEVVERFTADDDYQSDFMKNQIEFDGKPGEAMDTIYVDNIIRKGKSGAWYMKRGYIAGMFNAQRPEYAHLAGKFVGWVDNLTTGKCVLKIEDNVKTPIEETA